MRLKYWIYKSLAEPRLSQINYAEQCLEGQHSKVEEYLAAINMGLYPFVSKDAILENIRENREEIQQELEVAV